MKTKTAFSTFLMLFFLVIVFVMAVYVTKATFAGSHTMYKNRTSSDYGDAQLCIKCHLAQVVNITSDAPYKAHNSTVCICHGYYPNNTAVWSGPHGIFHPGQQQLVNLKHNLTMNIYCTNCHTGYNTTGDLYILGGSSNTPVNVINQSAHYIYLNGSNTTTIDDTYDRSWRYFNNSFGPLS